MKLIDVNSAHPRNVLGIPVFKIGVHDQNVMFLIFKKKWGIFDDKINSLLVT